MSVTAYVVLSFVFALVPVLCGYLLRGWVRGLVGRRGPAAPALTYSPWLFPACLLMGGVGGVVFALALGPAFGNYVAPDATGLGDALLRHAIAEPLAEELGKGLLVLALFAARRVRTLLDGLVLGLAAGVGYATVENFVAFMLSLATWGTDGWWGAVQVRLAFSLFIHGAASACMGAYLGAARSHGGRLVVMSAPLAGVSAALLVHGLWNGLLVAAEHGAPWVGAMALIVPLGSVTALVLAVRRVLRAPPPVPLGSAEPVSVEQVP